MTTPSTRAERDLHLPGAITALSDAPASLLTSMLLPVMAAHAARRPADLARQHAADAFATPCDLNARSLVRLDAALFDHMAPVWEAVELSPVSPLGSCAAVAATSQDRVLSSLRNLEVVADPTNTLALEVARRGVDSPVHLACSHRVLRCQRFHKPGFKQHFRLLAGVVGGKDPGGRAFDRGALLVSMRLVLDGLDAARALGHPVPAAQIRLQVSRTHEAWALDALRGAGLEPEAVDALADDGYYAGLRWQVYLGEDAIPVADGGAVDWLARLRSDRRARLYTAALGTELLVRLFPRG